MAGILAEEVNRLREVRAYGLTPGIAGAANENLRLLQLQTAGPL